MFITLKPQPSLIKENKFRMQNQYPIRIPLKLRIQNLYQLRIPCKLVDYTGHLSDLIIRSYELINDITNQWMLDQNFQQINQHDL